MFMTRSEYDRGVTTFSPEGRLFQVEYAIEAIKLGSTAIAILTKEGIVLAVERRTQSPLMVPSSLDKIMEIDSHVACAVSGLTADAQSMVEHGRVQAQNHYFTYNESMPVQSLTQSLCALSANFGTDEEGSMSRPFGVALLLFFFIKPDLKLLHGLIAVHVLRFFRACRDNPGWQVGDTDGRVGCIHVLSAGP